MGRRSLNAVDLYAGGYKDLVSVVPPKGPLSMNTTITPESRGKVPGVVNATGKWRGYGWDHAASPALVKAIVRTKANIGLRGERFPGLDIDCEDEQLVTFVTGEAVKALGPAPVRLSREPRRLLVYRAEEPFGRIACRIQFKGQEHVVEMLGAGRQYLIAGTHPSGVEYGWDGTDLMDWPVKDLSLVTRDDVLKLMETIKEKLAGRAEVMIEGTGKTSAELAPPQDDLIAPSIRELARVVVEIPNEYPDRDSYIRMGCAIKAAAAPFEDGRRLFQYWAAKWEGGNDPETVDTDWDRMRGPFRIGWAWLQELAAGSSEYIPASDEFQADPEARPLSGDTSGERGGVPGSHAALDGSALANAHLGAGNVIEMTDAWVTEVLAVDLEPHLRFVPETGRWHWWNGHAWGIDRLNRADRLVRQRLNSLAHEMMLRADVNPVEADKKRGYAFARQLQSASARSKILAELECHERLTLLLEHFDANPWLLNTPGGLIDLRTGTVSPPDPLALQSKATAVAVDPGPPTRWLQFLHEATGGDKALILFLQKQAGYALTGLTVEQTLTFVHGPSLTGKSVFIDTLGGVWGSYHQTADADTFATTGGSSRHPTDLAMLAGARLVTTSETQEGRSWDMQRIKSITGGDAMVARFMRQDFFDFKPTFKIVIVGNHEPEILGVDEAIMRRIHIVPFVHRPEVIDRLLSDKLQKEWGSILAWAVEGCRLWLAEGLTPPLSVLVRTEEYREEEDPVGRFLDERCVFVKSATVTSLGLYESWRGWCHQQGDKPGTQKQLKRRFRTHLSVLGVTAVRLSREDGTRPHGYRGMGLTTITSEEFV